MIGAVAKRVVSSRALIQVPKRTIYPHTSSNHVAGLPRNRISFPEKVATGVFIASCILATPAWIVTHMDDYRGGPVGGG